MKLIEHPDREALTLAVAQDCLLYTSDAADE